MVSRNSRTTNIITTRCRNIVARIDASTKVAEARTHARTKPKKKRQAGKAKISRPYARQATQVRQTDTKARQGKARQGNARQGKARQGKARQDKARQGNARPGTARQGNAKKDRARAGEASVKS